MKTILIVEDTEINIDLLTQLLEDEYHLLIARDGVQALTLADQGHPDLILMDISLPGMDGYAATRAILARHASLPILGLSAHAMAGDADKASAAGCSDYLTKPLDEILLFQKIKAYIG